MKQKTKYKFLALFMLNLIMAAMFVQADIVADGDKIDVSLISQEPDPANPGEVIDLRFKVTNLGGDSTKEIVFEFLEEYPFSIYSGTAQQDIGSLQSRQVEDNGVIVLYKIKVDENAVEKTYYPDIRYKSGRNGHWVTVKDFPIRVRTRDLIMALESIKTKPELVSPGKEFELSFTLRNNADSLLRDARVKLDLTGSDIPFAPSTSTSEKKIYQINARTGKIMRFNLLALPDADGGVYKVPVNVSYTDESGNSYSREDMISLKISSVPDLLLTIDSSDITADQKSGDIVIKIVNRGLTDIKLLTAEILDNKKVQILSEPEIYVGNIDSDDYETVEYNVAVRSYSSVVDVPIELKYRDSTNKEHEQLVVLNLKTYSSGFIATIIQGIIGLIVKLAVALGIGYGIYIVYKKIKKRKEEKEQ